MKSLLMSAALFGATVSMTAVAAANDDGFFNVSYNNIGFELTQIGGYGELTINPQGFNKMGFGSCTVNFKRDASGAAIELTPVVQSSSATCPESVAFSTAPAKDGMYKIKFTEGGPLAGEEFDLFPVLRPMSEEYAVTAPKGFDILGATIGMKRAEIEAIMTREGYEAVDAYKSVSEFENGRVRHMELWAKGNSDDMGRPEDTIAVTYTTVKKGEEDNAQAEALGRKWSIPASANISTANLKKSLADKHGVVTSQFDGRFYNRAGELDPKAFQQVCAKNVHLQGVTTYLNMPGVHEEFPVSPSCGAVVDIMVLESFETKGLANLLQVKLKKGDVAYSAFWESWSEGEAADLQKRYEAQTAMQTSAPKL